MEISGNEEWNQMLQAHGINFFRKKAEVLSAVWGNETDEKTRLDGVRVFTVQTKNDSIAEFKQEKYYDDVGLEKNSEKGTIELDTGSISKKNLQILLFKDLPTLRLEGRYSILRSWSIGKDLNEKQTLWSEQRTEIKKASTLVYTVITKIWNYLPNGDLWGESSSTYQPSPLEPSTQILESWKDNQEERYYENSVKFLLDSSVKSEKGHRERCSWKGRIPIDLRKDLNEIQTERHIERWNNNYSIGIEFYEQYWVKSNPLTKETMMNGEKKGWNGKYKYGEKWSKASGLSSTDKWNEEQIDSSTTKKWGEIINDYIEDRKETINWTELHKGDYSESTHDSYTLYQSGRRYGLKKYTNSVKKISTEYWAQNENQRYSQKFDDDGFGQKTTVITGSDLPHYEYKDVHSENVEKNLRISTKEGFDSNTKNKWKSKIIDCSDYNKVKHVGENWGTKDKWKEKWFDNKKGEKWAKKEGSNEIEQKQWREEWHEQRESDKPQHLKCEKWGREKDCEWFEKWTEGYDSNSVPQHKFCEKRYKQDSGFHRGYRVSQNNAHIANEEGQTLWDYKVDEWENEDFHTKFFQQYDQFMNLILFLQSNQI